MVASAAGSLSKLSSPDDITFADAYAETFVYGANVVSSGISKVGANSSLVFASATLDSDTDLTA